MRITIDPDSGFCFGVSNAIKTAESELDAGKELYSLGELVHNNIQMDVLKQKGLKVIEHQDLANMSGKTVLVRAHGEPPETYRLAEKYGVKIIDATCPIVEKLQQRVNQSYVSGMADNAQVVLYGKQGHAEMIGLSGNAENAAIVVSSEADFGKIDISKPVILFSQTTMDAEGYQSIANKLAESMKAAGNTSLVVNRSVCRQVSNRAPALRTFAAAHDVLIFVAGPNSSNGAYLYSICKLVNEKSFFVSNIKDINKSWFANAETIGVTGATSTPGWLIKQAAAEIQELCA